LATLRLSFFAALAFFCSWAWIFFLSAGVFAFASAAFRDAASAASFLERAASLALFLPVFLLA
jgi:exopolyphosphatase/pppGpp-phosphohydrolase